MKERLSGERRGRKFPISSALSGTPEGAGMRGASLNFVIPFRMRISSSERAELLAIIDRFARQRIVLLGDFVADEFIHGEIVRVSREAPVLILKQRDQRIVPGGGANAANNLVELGAQLALVGV